MTPQYDHIKPPAHVHFIGIGGTGMGALAGLFHEQGYRVTGSDKGIYPPMSDFLARRNIRTLEGYAADNLTARPDLVVVGNVITGDNPEAVCVMDSGIPYVTMPQALSTFFVRNRKTIVVTGTHGKTTVSAMIAWVLHEAGLDPGFFIGGILKNFHSNARVGSGNYFVIEGDEYDTAFFEKTPKFLHYRPHIGILTSCEFDHADIYRSLTEISDQFLAFTKLVPPTGYLLGFMGDERVRRILGTANGWSERYDISGDADWHAEVLYDSGNGLTGIIRHNERVVASGTLPIVGRHNLLNATAAVAVAHRLGVVPQQAFWALQSFRGVHRRQEVLATISGITIIDDFAHHPSAVRVTLEGIRARYPKRRLIAVFEPRTNTSRRAVFQNEYPAAFDAADVIVTREPRGIEAFDPGNRFSSAQLVEDLRRSGKTAHALPDTDGILEHLTKEVRRDDVILLMSNGNFDNLGRRLADVLREKKL